MKPLENAPWWLGFFRLFFLTGALLMALSPWVKWKMLHALVESLDRWRNSLLCQRSELLQTLQWNSWVLTFLKLILLSDKLNNQM